MQNYVKEMAPKPDYYVEPTDEREQEHLPEDEVVVITDSEKARRSDLITKLKIISLHEMGKPPLTNPNTLTKKERETLMEKMQVYLDDIPTADESITQRFNELCNDCIFNQDYTQYPIYLAPYQRIEKI
jgi:hypothetical protein